MRKQVAAGAGLTLGTTLAFGGVAHAACTCTVDSLADPTATGHTTLRDAILSAEANPGSTITFASGLSGTIALDGTALPQITVPIAISGPGANVISVNAGGASRVFRIDEAVYGDPVTISGLTITGGNTGGAGAGIYDRYASLTVNDAVISGNTAGGDGGGIAVIGAGNSLSVSTSTISGNSSDRGGGIYTQSSDHIPTTLRSSTLSGNDGGDYGGGVYFDYSAPATVENSTIYGNTVTGSGGGLYHYGTPTPTPGLTVTGATITHNTAARGGGLASNDGAAYTRPILRDTIISGNTATTGPDLSTQSATIDAAFSLLGSIDPATPINQSGPDILGADPQLGPLADNGGPTETQLPADSSPAIDKGSAFGLSADQRGGPRPLEFPGASNAAGGDGSDIGAVEVESNRFRAEVKGKKLFVTVFAPGKVTVSDAHTRLSAAVAKKKRKLSLRSSSASGGPPRITVPLRLTKLAKNRLRRNGKVAVRARVTFAPKFGAAKTEKLKLRIRGKPRR